MSKRDFRCQVQGVDAADDWTIVSALYPEFAARDYAERADDDSAGELFPGNDSTQIIIVQDGDRSMMFQVRASWSKDFSARQVRA